jgi:hypothetical protein
MELPLTSQPDARTREALLTAAHRQHLYGSAIIDAIIAERGYRSIASRTEWRAFDDTMPDRQITAPGIAFPVFRLGLMPPYAWLLRPDRPRLSQGTSPRPIKYEWPARVRPCLDVASPQRMLLADPTIPIWITEGAKKADALRSLYGDHIVPINLNGVWAWRGTSAAGGKLVLPDMDEIAWNGRTVVLAFDSDVVRKKQVLAALQRLAVVLNVRGVAEVRVLLLSQQGSDKCGVDDFLAGGNDAAALEAHLAPLGEAVVARREKLFTHPLTHADIYLPPGYLVSDATNALCRLDRHGQPTVIYPGFLAVTATGVDLASGDETLTVRWNRRGDQHGEVTAPRAELARSKGILDRMAALGAAVHDENARPIARYLVEFAHENCDALPRLSHLDRLGVVGNGVVLPAGSVGCIPPIIYRGRSTVCVGDNEAIYGETLRQAMTWPDAWSFWAVFALTLASPLIVRLRPRRNPALYLAGESGSGKTTIAQFAVGAYGDPTRAPLLVQAQRTTVAGFFQSLEHLGGLPLFVDEAHTAGGPGTTGRACLSVCQRRDLHAGRAGRQDAGWRTAGRNLAAGRRGAAGLPPRRCAPAHALDRCDDLAAAGARHARAAGYRRAQAGSAPRRAVGACLGAWLRPIRQASTGADLGRLAHVHCAGRAGGMCRRARAASGLAAATRDCRRNPDARFSGCQCHPRSAYHRTATR